jgi:acyl carrier protein
VADLTAIVAEVLSLPASSISDASGPETVPEWDSLAHMRLVAKLEEAFGVRFDLDEIIQMENVGKIKGLLAKKQT